MNPSDIFEVRGFQENGLLVLGRIYKLAGTPIVQSDLAADPNGIVCEVYNKSLNYTVIGTIAGVATSNIFNSLVTNDPRWKTDAIGYNFLFYVPAAMFALGETEYLVKFTFTPLSGDPINSALVYSTVALPQD